MHEDSPFDQFLITVGQSKELSSSYDNLTKTLAQIEPFLKIKFDHENAQELAPKLGGAVKGWCGLLDRSMGVARACLEFAGDTEYWLDCLTRPRDSVTIESLNMYLETIHASVEENKSSIEAFAQEMHEYRDELKKLDSNIKATKDEMKTKESEDRRQLKKDVTVLSSVSGSSILVAGAAGVLLPPTLLVSVPVGLLAIVGTAYKTLPSIIDNRKRVNTERSTSNQLNEIQSPFDSLKDINKNLTEWWDTMHQNMDDLKSQTKWLTPESIHHSAIRIQRAREQLKAIHSQLSSWERQIRLLRDDFPREISASQASVV